MQRDSPKSARRTPRRATSARRCARPQRLISSESWRKHGLRFRAGGWCRHRAAARSCARSAEALRARKADLGLLVTARNRQDPQRRRRRNSRNDRHVRFRRRVVAPALRPDDRQRAPAAPNDRAMAAPGADRNHHGLQFPGRRLGVERHDRGCLRRHHDLEAIAARTTLLDRGTEDRGRSRSRRTIAKESSTSASAVQRTSAKP